MGMYNANGKYKEGLSQSGLVAEIQSLLDCATQKARDGLGARGTAFAGEPDEEPDLGTHRIFSILR